MRARLGSEASKTSCNCGATTHMPSADEKSNISDSAFSSAPGDGAERLTAAAAEGTGG